MKILIVCHRFPSFSGALTYRVVNSLKYLKLKYGHTITLLCFKNNSLVSRNDEEYVAKYCDKILNVEIPPSQIKRIFNYSRDYLVRILSLKLDNPWNYAYSREMGRKAAELVRRENFDIIFADTSDMLPYVSYIDIPKVLEIWTKSQYFRYASSIENNIQKRLLYLIAHFRAKKDEKHYRKFDICLTSTEEDKKIINADFPDLKITAIPFGINRMPSSDNLTDVIQEVFPSIVFTGTMSDIANQNSIINFYNDVFPIIKSNFPEIKLYIVGKDPPQKILDMRRDNSVIVTGYVPDMWPYLAKASVVVLPTHGYGIKTRVLEAMVAGKAIVTSPEGVHGLNITRGENILIAHDEAQFADMVRRLLRDEQLRKKIGANAKKLVEEDYSWEILTDKLNAVLQSVAQLK